MNVVSIIGIAVITAISAIVIKQFYPDLSNVIVIVGGLILVFQAFGYLSENIQIITQIVDKTGLDKSLIKTLFKMVGVGYLFEFASGVLCDLGQNSLSDKLILCGKIFLLVLTLPILQNVLLLVEKLLSLI